MEINYKNIKKKARHKASTKISELKDELLDVNVTMELPLRYEPRIREKHKDVGTLRICDEKGVEQGSEAIGAAFLLPLHPFHDFKSRT